MSTNLSMNNNNQPHIVINCTKIQLEFQLTLSYVRGLYSKLQIGSTKPVMKYFSTGNAVRRTIKKYILLVISYSNYY